MIEDIESALGRIEGKLDSHIEGLRDGPRRPPSHHLGHTWITFAVTLVTALGLLA